MNIASDMNQHVFIPWKAKDFKKPIFGRNLETQVGHQVEIKPYRPRTGAINVNARLPYIGSKKAPKRIQGFGHNNDDRMPLSYTMETKGGGTEVDEDFVNRLVKGLKINKGSGLNFS